MTRTPDAVHALTARMAVSAGKIRQRYVYATTGGYVNIVTGHRLPAEEQRRIDVLVRHGYAAVDADSGKVAVTGRGRAGALLVDIGTLSPAMVQAMISVQEGNTGHVDPRTISALRRRRAIYHNGRAWAPTGYGDMALAAIMLSGGPQ